MFLLDDNQFIFFSLLIVFLSMFFYAIERFSMVFKSIVILTFLLIFFSIFPLRKSTRSELCAMSSYAPDPSIFGQRGVRTRRCNRLRAAELVVWVANWFSFVFSLPTSAIYYLLLFTFSRIQRPRGGIFGRAEKLRFFVDLAFSLYVYAQRLRNAKKCAFGRCDSCRQSREPLFQS